MSLVIPVRMHFNTQDLWFDPAKSQAMAGDHVVVSTERGTEFGLATRDPFEAPEEEVHGSLKPVLRIATEADIRQAEGLARKGEEAMPLFRRLIEKHGLDMKPVGVEFLFGGEKVVFYFAAEERVDFRELVHELAQQFRMRVDMRQIGVRDEVRLMGGYAPCGQELCCARLGGKFEPVSIRMAKEQDLPLNSAKISGVCGRLMCCLRYEFEAYKDFKQRAPKRNALIDTPLGKAKIVEYNTPRETVTMRLENGKSFTVALKDMTCSKECPRSQDKDGVPAALRPDTVTRETLEALGTAEIMAQLAELDRANNPQAYELDSSLLAPSRQRRSQPVQQATTRRRSTRIENDEPPAADSGARTKPADVEKQGDTRPANRKGMRPRRGSASSSVEDQPQPKTRTRRVSRKEQDKDAQPMRPAAQPTQASGEPAKRTRRRYAGVEEGGAPEQSRQRNADRQRSQGRVRDASETASQDRSSDSTRQRTRRRHVTADATQDEQPRQRRAEREQAPRDPQPRTGKTRVHRASSEQQAPEQTAEKPKSQVRRTHRKPGDHGGNQAAGE